MIGTRYVDIDGHRLGYRLSGNGPALVVLSLYRRRQDMMQARMLSDTFQVFQVAPLGYGYSDRVPGYAGERLAEQVLRVLDHHDVDHFVVSGYSAGGAMALCIAQSTRVDRKMARQLRALSGQLSLQHADVMEIPGLDHAACNTPMARERDVVPAVAEWLRRRVGPTW